MLIAATDRKVSMLPFEEQIALIAKAKPDMLILTERDLSPSEYKELALSCKAECDKKGVEFCIDKFIDVAKEIGVRSIHLSLDDIRDSDTEGFERVLVSIRSEKEAVEAERLGATMIIFVGVFDVSCRTCRNAKGLSLLRDLLGAVDIPVSGAGGILPDVFLEVLASETAGICMGKGFMRTKEPVEAVVAYHRAQKQLRTVRR
jgi:thiamine-phosphate pyrophosphorylase